MREYVVAARLPRVVLGAGALLGLPNELERLGAGRAIVLSTPGQRTLAERAAALLGERCAGVFAEARMHVPVEVARAAAGQARRLGAHGAVAIGGGSTTGSARRSCSMPACPSSRCRRRAGREVTAGCGLTEAGLKTTGRDLRALPRTVVYDAELSSSLPLVTSVVSMVNAIAHAAEGLYAPDVHPVIDAMAEEGIRSGVAALLQQDAADVEARGEALVAAWLRTPCSAMRRSACTTSSATRSAAASTCRTPRSTQ